MLAPLLTATPIVVISELMWMGDFSSPRHEWIELYNTTNPSKIKTGSSDVNDPNRYSGIGLFLISNNRAKDCNLAVIPDLVEASVTLTNTQLQVKLYDVAGRLIDTADDGIGKPMAGDSAQKKAMVRRLNDRSPKMVSYH